MATKLDELLAERKRIRALHATLLPDRPVFKTETGSEAASVEESGLLFTQHRYLNRREAIALAAFITKWYSDQTDTPPSPDHDTLRKAAMFDKLVDEAQAVVDAFDAAVANPANMCDELIYGEFCESGCVDGLRAILAKAEGGAA